MSGRWVEVEEERGRRGFWFSPGLLAIVAVGLLIAVIIAGVIVSQQDNDSVLRDITIADLRADPDRYDQRTLELTGTVENVYTIPILEQYGIYDFRDETGSMLVLTRRGVPPEGGEQVRLTATFNSAVTLDEQIKRLVEEELGSVIGGIVDQVLPGLPLNVIYLNHEKYETLDETPQTGFFKLTDHLGSHSKLSTTVVLAPVANPKGWHPERSRRISCAYQTPWQADEILRLRSGLPPLVA